jgi:hypothetical protein
VDHHRPVLGVVRPGVGQPELLGHVVVELHGAELPGPLEGVGHVEIDLRPIEGAVALVQVVLEPAALERPLERGLGPVPHVLAADALLGARRELQPRLEPEQVVDEEPEVEAAQDLLVDLLLGAEHVRVVLGDVPDAQQAVQRAARLVAVDEPLLGVADREVAVGVQVALVDLDVGRAVHRLEAHGPLLHVREVHVVAVDVPVARLLPELAVVEDRRADLDVAAVHVRLAPDPGELVPDVRAVRQPERRAG